MVICTDADRRVESRRIASPIDTDHSASIDQ